MNTLYWLVTITDRPTTDAFLKLYKSFGVDVSLRTVGAGTAVQETLSTLGLEKTEKAVLFAIITADSWPRIQKALRRQMRIDVPGTGIAFIVPVSSIGGKRALLFLTEHQTLELKEDVYKRQSRYRCGCPANPCGGRPLHGQLRRARRCRSLPERYHERGTESQS